MEVKHDKKPECAVARRKGKYVSYENGEFWIQTSDISYRAGHMMNPHDEGALETAIYNHEEECRVLATQFRQFG